VLREKEYETVLEVKNIEIESVKSVNEKLLSSLSKLKKEYDENIALN
jgi:hypothetical protein